jgi:hypothetical protein
MGSSGIIYAIIVGAWAIYLVPMWLRREDELNRARQTQRYAAAIKVLANKEAFERRWAQQSESDADQALPLAVGQSQSSVPVSASRATQRVTGTGAGAPQTTLAASPVATKSAKRPVAAAGVTVAATASRGAVTAKIAAPADPADTRARSARPSRPRTATPTSVTAAPSTAGTPGTSAAPGTQTARRSAAAGLKVPVAGTRTGLMARRRRVVAVLFAVSTLGALISADLGARYLWVMAIPAVLLSAYIAQLRREERIRATARAAKRAAAQQAREARETELAQAEAAAAEAAHAQAAETEAVRVRERSEAEERRRTEAARRRASAAARARAQAYTQETPDLPQASNG